MSDTPVSAALEPIPPSSDKAAYWRAILTDFATSGQSVRHFCRARGLHEKRFYTWRRDLGLRPVAPRPVPSSDAPARAFVPVRVVSDAVAEVGLPGGVTVRVPVSADPAHVARLVAAVRGATC